jgi:hypothetical protein
MDLQLIRNHLLGAERHVALSDRCIERQVELVDELTREGHSTVLALDVLHTFRMVRATHLAHRDMIRKELASWRHVSAD